MSAYMKLRLLHVPAIVFACLTVISQAATIPATRAKSVPPLGANTSDTGAALTSLAALDSSGGANPALGLSREAQLVLDEMPSKGVTWGALAKVLQEEVQKSPHGKDIKISVDASLVDKPISGHVQQFPPHKVIGPINNYPVFMFLTRFTDGLPVKVGYTKNQISISPKAAKRPAHPRR